MYVCVCVCMCIYIRVYMECGSGYHNYIRLTMFPVLIYSQRAAEVKNAVVLLN